MNKLAAMLAEGTLSVEELASANELIERAQLVEQALEACKRTLVFPLGENKISCYHYIDSFGEYEAWGTCTNDGLFSCWCNWGGDHIVGQCNLTNYRDVFMALEQEDFKDDLIRFLKQQIEKVGSDAE